MKIPRSEISAPSVKPVTTEQSMDDFVKAHRDAQLPSIKRNAQLADRERRALYGSTEVDRHNDGR